MRFKAPFIGEVTIGETPKVKTIFETIKEKGILGGFVDLFNDNSLVTVDKASEKLLEANQGWVYKNNDVIAKEVGTIEFELFTTRRVGQEIQYVPITAHPILDALDRINEYTDASAMFYLTESYKNLAGDAFWLIEGEGINIKNIYQLRPDKVTLNFGNYQAGERVISSYTYKDTVKGVQVEQTYKPEEIIHFKRPNPINPYRGKSIVEAAAESIDTDNYAIEANKALYKRGMINNFVLSTDKSLTTEQRKDLRAEINKNYAGVANAFRVLLLSGGLKPETIQQSNKDMEFIQQQEWLRDKIMVMFGNTKSILGITDDVNRANAEATILSWKRQTIKPEMKAITDTLNEYFVPRFGGNLILGFKEPVPEDEDAKIDRVVKLKSASIITPNEAREMLELDPAKEQDADQLKPTVQVPDAVKNVNYKRHLRKTDVYTQIQKYKELVQASRPIAAKLVKGRRKSTPPQEPKHEVFTDIQVTKYWEKQIRIVEALEPAFENAVKQFIDRLVDKAIAQVPEEIADIQQKALYDDEQEIVQATIDFTPLLNDVALLAGQEALALVGDDSPFINRDLRKLIERNVRKFTKSMLETDRDKIIEIIAQGIADGKSVPEIRELIVHEFKEKADPYSKMQAQRITRTEVLRASNQGALQAFIESDVVIAKEWLTAGATDQCAEYNGKVVELKGSFYDDHNEFQDGDPPLHPNCRCVLLPVIDIERAYKPETIEQKAIYERRINELEANLDKRTKEYRDFKKQADKDRLDDAEYIKGLEEITGETRAENQTSED